MDDCPVGWGAAYDIVVSTGPWKVDYETWCARDSTVSGTVERLHIVHTMDPKISELNSMFSLLWVVG